MERLLYRVDEAAGLIGIGRTKTYELVASGQLRSVLIGRARRIPADALAEFVESLAADSKPELFPGRDSTSTSLERGDMTSASRMTPTPSATARLRNRSHRGASASQAATVHRQITDEKEK